MREVLISIQPKWCELIASGKKTVEVRKTRPKTETPFKVYIYCTQTKTMGDFILCKSVENAKLFGFNTAKGINKGFAKKEDIQLKGKVIGEFVCDDVEYYTSNCTVFESVLLPSPSELEEMCLTLEEFNGYGTRGKLLYGWHISNLVIYDKPKELSEFYMSCGDNPKCDGCEAHYYSSTECGTEDYCCSIIYGHRPLKRPPQSWCYVELLKEGADNEHQ